VLDVDDFLLHTPIPFNVLLLRRVTYFALSLRATGNYVFLRYVKYVTEQLFLSLFLGKESRDNKKTYMSFNHINML